MHTQTKKIVGYIRVTCNISLNLVEQSKFAWLFKENAEGLSRSSTFSLIFSIPSLLDRSIPTSSLDTHPKWFSFSRKSNFSRKKKIENLRFYIFLNKECFHFRSLFCILKASELSDLGEFVLMCVNM